MTQSYLAKMWQKVLTEPGFVKNQVTRNTEGEEQT